MIDGSGREGGGEGRMGKGGWERDVPLIKPDSAGEQLNEIRIYL